MSYARAFEYTQAILPLMAEESLNAIRISSFPYLKKEKAKNVQKEYQSLIKNSKAPQQKNTADIYQHLLRTLGNG